MLMVYNQAKYPNIAPKSIFPNYCTFQEVSELLPVEARYQHEALAEHGHIQVDLY